MLAAIAKGPIHPIKPFCALRKVAINRKVEKISRRKESLKPAHDSQIIGPALGMKIVRLNDIPLGFDIELLLL